MRQKNAIMKIGDRMNDKYKTPPLTILSDEVDETSPNNDFITEQINKIENTLNTYNINAKVVEVKVGPLDILYALEFAMGQKVDKILNIKDEIGFALGTKDVSILIPIPGTSKIGIELPTKTSNVYLRKALDDKTLKEIKEFKVPAILGKDPIGNTISVDLSKNNKLLINGVSGVGKSMLINSIIMSNLILKKPDEVKFLIVDTKRVEFSSYNGIPHLICPIISEYNQIISTLNKIREEIAYRINKFQHTGTKNINQYNEYVKEHNNELEYMPYLVIIIDELTDVYTNDNNLISNLIVDIAVKSKMTGICQIITTNGINKEIISQELKEIIPFRITFITTTAEESRIIIDQEGAEKLHGKGEMLIKIAGKEECIRAKNITLLDEEINRTTTYIKNQMSAEYNEKFIKTEETKQTPKYKKKDELYNTIVDFVVKTQKASASLLQRKFKMGYNQAATMIDKLEENGIIGPATGNSKPREVLVKYSKEE